MTTRIVTYKCPFCDKRFNKGDLVVHIEDNHSYEIPKDFTPLRYVFNYVNKKPLSYHGKCTECGGPTPWDENVGRYKRQCGSKACHDSYVRKFEQNMIRTKGTDRISKTEEGQRKMLANRKISGTYTFRNGEKKTYTGSYEKKALEFMDKVMNIDPKDLMCPGPILEYKYDGKKHIYITDFYYIPYNLIIEVKDGGDNPNKRNMPEYRAKQIIKEKTIIKDTNYNYLRLTNNDLKQLIAVFMDLKLQLADNTGKRVIHVNEKTLKVCPKCGSDNIGIKIAGEPIYFCKDCGAYVDDVPFNEQMGAAMSMAPIVGLDKADTYITLEPKENNVFSSTISALDGKNRYGLSRETHKLVRIPDEQKIFGKKYKLNQNREIVSETIKSLVENEIEMDDASLYQALTCHKLYSKDQIGFDLEAAFEDTFDAEKFVNNLLHEKSDIDLIEESIKELIING